MRTSKFSDAEKREIVEYARVEGMDAACAKYGIGRTIIWKWKVHETPVTKVIPITRQYDAQDTWDTIEKLQAERDALRTEVANLRNELQRRDDDIENMKIEWHEALRNVDVASQRGLDVAMQLSELRAEIYDLALSGISVVKAAGTLKNKNEILKKIADRVHES